MSRTTRVGTRRQFRLAWLLMAAMSVLSAGPALADQEGFGLRAGVSADPDQFVLGLHYDTGPFIERLSFRPNAELGLGDNVTLVAFNFDLAYWIPLKGKPWQLYVGGGPAMNIYVFDNGNGPGPGGDDTDVEPGFNLLFGAAHAKGLFFEVKVGAIDSPDFKAVVGYSFGK